MKNKIVLITGASSGIGWETALALARQEAEVLVICRNSEQGKAVVTQLRQQTGNLSTDFLVADLADLQTVSNAAEDFKSRYNRLDVLINNAGVLYMNRSETANGHESHFGINYLSHFLLTRLLLPELENSAEARVINVSSDAHAWSKLDLNNLELKRHFKPLTAYAWSKLEQVYFTYELARRLKGSTVSANALHPGFVSTGIARTNFLTNAVFQVLAKPFILTPEQGAATTIFLASDPKLAGISGKFFEKSKPVNSSSASYDTETARKLWELSEEMLAAWLNPSGKK